MSFTSGELRDFVDAVRGSETSTECVVTGTVARVDPDGTAWVQIGQNAEPTPCARNMACHAGDEVTVRIADHKATVTGNASAPATDDHAANVAHGVASVAQETATVAQDTAEVAQSTANQAKKVASNAATKADVAEIAAQEAARVAAAVNQHFWDDERGAHVTEEAKDEYQQEPSGFQQLMTSIGTLLTRAVSGIEYLLRSDTRSGMAIYDGACTADDANLPQHLVASFTADGAQIGKSSSGHMVIDDDELSIYGTVYDPWGEEPATIGRTGHISQEDVELGNVNGTTFIVNSAAENDVVGSCYRNGSFPGQDFYLNVQKIISEDVVVPSNRYFFFSDCRYAFRENGFVGVMYNGVELQAGIDYTLYPTSGIYIRSGIAVGATITVVYKTSDRVTRFGLDQTGAKGDDNAFGIFPPTEGARNVTPNFGVDWDGHITHIEGSTTKADNLAYVSSGELFRVQNCISPSHSIPANWGALYTYNVPSISGYKAIGVVGFQNTAGGNVACVSAFVNITAQTISTYNRNWTNTAHSINDHIRVLYIRDGFAV